VLARRRLGVLGGTFDPIHHVHLLMAREAIRRLRLDGVVFVPTGEPSHRDPAEVSAASDRCAMVRLALTDEARCALSTVDVRRPRPTYTVDTVRDLRARHGLMTDLYIIVGADNLADIPRWRDSAELLRLARVVGSSRLGYPLVDPGLPAGRLTLLPIPQLDVSATKIRALVGDGRPVHHLTPEAVARYIDDHGLYTTQPMARRR
jgi:nicotinate-nucleotide adenylyltransferase